MNWKSISSHGVKAGDKVQNHLPTHFLQGSVGGHFWRIPHKLVLIKWLIMLQPSPAFSSSSTPGKSPGWCGSHQDRELRAAKGETLTSKWRERRQLQGLISVTDVWKAFERGPVWRCMTFLRTSEFWFSDVVYLVFLTNHLSFPVFFTHWHIYIHFLIEVQDTRVKVHSHLFPAPCLPQMFDCNCLFLRSVTCKLPKRPCIPPYVLTSFSISSSSEISSSFSSFFLSFFSTKPGGRACRYIQLSPPPGHTQNHPYLLFSMASRKYLHTCG